MHQPLHKFVHIKHGNWLQKKSTKKQQNGTKISFLFKGIYSVIFSCTLESDMFEKEEQKVKEKEINEK